MTRWLIRSRSSGQYFRGVWGHGSATSPVVAEWTPNPDGGIRFASVRDAFRAAHNWWGRDISNVRVVRRGKRGAR